MKGYAFHPEAEADLDTIWEYIAEDSPSAADRLIDRIETTSKGLSPSRTSAMCAPI